MPSVKPDTTIKEYQEFARTVYGKVNDLQFDLHDMLSNVERFAMRGLKGIRKGDKKKTQLNLLISLSWFVSTLNRLHINLEEEIWKRFPYLCSYCASSPCKCAEQKGERVSNIPIDESKKPVTMQDFQDMLKQIYPPEKRTINHAGVHLAEELGEFSEAILAYRGAHRSEDIERVKTEAADVFSTFAGIFNSLDISIAKELSKIFSKNCHICKKSPCECDFNFVVNFES